jgi:hypothetical protein
MGYETISAIGLSENAKTKTLEEVGVSRKLDRVMLG